MRQNDASCPAERQRGYVEMIDWKCQCCTLSNDGFSPIQGNFARTQLEWIMEDLKIKMPVNFYLQGLWTELDKDGVPNKSITKYGIGHDGDAYSNGNIRVQISKNPFPETWSVNDQLPGMYLNDVINLEDSYDLFTFLAAHELRHLWQWEHPKEMRQIRRLLKCDDEFDADVYAARMLSKYKTQ
jgi:hypothetical protein